jgi:hypothetical protein
VFAVDPTNTRGPTVSFVVEFTPYNFNSPVNWGAAFPGGGITPGLFSMSNFITNVDVVKGFRCIACCVKWIPNGPIATRSGVIGRSYAPSRLITPGVALSALDAMSSTSRQDTNGSVSHEVRWLPSFEDERFSSVTEVNVAGTGSVQMAGVNVDCSISGVGPYTYTANGYFEFTCVWEWEPVLTYGGSGITSSLNIPKSSTTLNDVLRAVGNAGKFVYDHGADIATAYSIAAGTRYIRRGNALRM